jgi:hypothetical protein
MGCGCRELTDDRAFGNSSNLYVCEPRPGPKRMRPHWPVSKPTATHWHLFAAPGSERTVFRSASIGTIAVIAALGTAAWTTETDGEARDRST